MVCVYGQLERIAVDVREWTYVPIPVITSTPARNRGDYNVLPTTDSLLCSGSGEIPTLKSTYASSRDGRA